MNEQKLTKYLASYKEWLTKNPSAANEAKQEQMEAQQKAHAFTKERLLSLSEDDLFEYLSPLWAMAMWGNKHYQIDNIIEARSKIKGIGPAIMSELLCKTYPAQYLLWNKKTYTGFKTLNINNLPRYEARLDGKMYEQLSGIGRELLAKSQEYGYNEICDLLALNSFIWNKLQDDSTDCTIPDKEEELIATSKKDATFIHNDIRDKVAEIGHCLGFRAEVEKKPDTKLNESQEQQSGSRHCRRHRPKTD